MIEASTQFMVGRLSTESGKCNRFNLDGIFGNDRSHYVRVLLILGQPNAGVQRRAKRVRCNSPLQLLVRRRVSQLHCRATHSVEDPRPAEGFPSAVRQLLVHPEHHATNVHRRTSRRCDKRQGVRTPLDFPATIQKNHFPVFRDLAQHLGLFVSRQAFVALSDSLLADIRGRDWAEAHRVIGPQFRQGNMI
jgi:hypothetical protein